MEKTKKEIRVCGCGAPLVWTFLYDGAEYFCLNCQSTGGMFGTGKDVPATAETRANEKVVQDVFKALRKHLWGSGGFTKSNCKKCRANTERFHYHPHHASKYERLKNEVADRMLDALKGSIIKAEVDPL